MIVTILVRQPIFSIDGPATLVIFWCCFEVVIWIARWIALYRLQAIDDWRSSIGWPTLGGELLVFGMFSGQLTVNDLSKMIDTIGFGLGLAGLFCLFTWAIRHARPGTWWVVQALVYAIGSLAIGLLLVTSVLALVSVSRTTTLFSSHPLLADVLSCLSAGALYLRFCINLRKARQAQGDAEYRAESSRSALV
jgi:hypothetical protein